MEAVKVVHSLRHWKILQKKQFQKTQVYQGVKRQRETQQGSRSLQLQRNSQEEKLLQRPQSCKSDFTGDKMESSLILEETSEFSATHKITEGTDIRSESKDSFWARVLFEQREMGRKWLVYKLSSIYILPYLAASRFSI